MKKIFAFLCGLIFVVWIVAIFVNNQKPTNVPSSHILQSHKKGNSGFPEPLKLHQPGLEERINQIAKRKPPETVSRLKPPLVDNPDLIENEFSLHFDTLEDLNKFLSRARKYKVTVLDILSKLNSVRVQVEDIDAFEKLLGMDPQPNELSSNYYVRTPDFPLLNDEPKDSAERVNHLAFEGNALDWLGLENRVEYRGKGILVAVLDTGILNHPTFKEGSITHLSMFEEPGKDEMNGHGTAMASLIAGNSPDAPGVAPDAKILSIQVLNDHGEGDTFTLAKGIVEAVDRGADVINLSLGSDGDSYALKQAIDYAMENDVLVVASVGNDGVEGIKYPAKYDIVVAVTGVDPLEQHAYFANTSMEVDIAAPATALHAAGTDNSIVHISGSSPPAAIVAGTAAIILSHNPNLSAEETKDILLGNTNDAGSPGKDPLFGHGILSIGRVQNRDQGGIFDMAMSGHFVGTSDNNDENLPIIVSAQNRGTEPLSKVFLNSTFGANNEILVFNNVGVGETVSGKFLLPKDIILKNEQLTISSSVSIAGSEETTLDNNEKTSILLISEPQDESGN